MNKMYFRYLVLSMMVVCMVSCEQESKVATPASEKISGPLSDYFEVVSSDYPINAGRVEVEFKRIKEGLPLPWNDNIAIGYADGCYEPQFMVEFLDTDGDVVSKDVTDIALDMEMLQSLMNLPKDGTATMAFDANGKGITGFKTLSALTFHKVGPCLLNLSGNISQTIDADMTIAVLPDGNARGAYYHKQFGPEAILFLMGEEENGTINLKEFSDAGTLIGTFEGNYENGTYTGTYESYDANAYDFTFSSNAEATPIYLADIDYGKFGSSGLEGYEMFYKDMFENAGIIPVATDTMTIVLDKQELTMKVGDNETLTVVTELSEGATTTWNSSDEAVVMVGATGAVRAIGAGEAIVTATIKPLKGNALTATASVKVKKVKTQSQAQGKSANIDLGYATYEPLPQNGVSGVKDGQPHGNGIMRFKSCHLIPGTQDCMAEPDEWVNGMWRDGKINVGTWYRNDSNQVIVKLGQRYNK